MVEAACDSIFFQCLDLTLDLGLDRLLADLSGGRGRMVIVGYLGWGVEPPEWGVNPVSGLV